MNKDAINIKNKEGTAAASNKSSEAEIYHLLFKKTVYSHIIR